MSKKIESDFGKGFVYSLMLFAKHWGLAQGYLKTWREMRKKNPDLFSDEDALELFFNGASDHLYELEIPQQFKNKQIGRLAKEIQSKSLYWGHGFKKKPTDKQFQEIFEKFEKVARLIDKELGVKTIKAKWN